VSLKVRIIPCLDVDAGRVVKGTNFTNLRDAGDPVELAALYDREGADEIVFYDITASHEQRETAATLARRAAEEVFVPYTIGGGVRTAEDMRTMLRAGADKVSVNSAAVRTPDLITEGAERFGSQCVVLSVDVKRRNGSPGWEIYLNGGRVNTGMDAIGWLLEGERRGAAGLDHVEERVPVAVEPDLDHPLRVAARRALAPELGAGPGEVVGLAARERRLDGLAVGVSERQHVARRRVLGHHGHEAVIVEPYPVDDRGHPAGPSDLRATLYLLLSLC